MSLVQSLLIILGIISVGVICNKRKVLNANQIEGFEIFLFKIAMPCYLFTSVLHHDLAALVNVQYIFSYLLSFSVITVMVLFSFYKNSSSSAIYIKILLSAYANAAIYALPVITFLLGDPIAGVLGNVLQIIVIQSVFITLLSFVSHKEKSIFGRLLVAFSTPLVAMPTVGLLCNYLHVSPYPVITDITQGLGVAAPGVALFSFGLMLGGVRISKTNVDRDLLQMVLLKNIFHPLIAFCIGNYVFHLEPYWLYSLVIATSAPTAFIVYLTAKQFSVEQNLAKTVVTVSSVASLVSLVIFVIVAEKFGAIMNSNNVYAAKNERIYSISYR